VRGFEHAAKDLAGDIVAPEAPDVATLRNHAVDGLRVQPARTPSHVGRQPARQHATDRSQAGVGGRGMRSALGTSPNSTPRPTMRDEGLLLPAGGPRLSTGWGLRRPGEITCLVMGNGAACATAVRVVPFASLRGSFAARRGTERGWATFSQGGAPTAPQAMLRRSPPLSASGPRASIAPQGTPRGVPGADEHPEPTVAPAELRFDPPIGPFTGGAERPRGAPRPRARHPNVAGAAAPIAQVRRYARRHDGQPCESPRSHLAGVSARRVGRRARRAGARRPSAHRRGASRVPRAARGRGRDRVRRHQRLW